MNKNTLILGLKGFTVLVMLLIMIFNIINAYNWVHLVFSIFTFLLSLIPLVNNFVKLPVVSKYNDIVYLVIIAFVALVTLLNFVFDGKNFHFNYLFNNFANVLSFLLILLTFGCVAGAIFFKDKNPMIFKLLAIVCCITLSIFGPSILSTAIRSDGSLVFYRIFSWLFMTLPVFFTLFYFTLDGENEMMYEE